MAIDLTKAFIKYGGYNGLKDSRNLTHTIFSFLNRYPSQTNALKELALNSSDKLKLTFIGLAQGEEALTNIDAINSIIEKQGKTLSNCVDLTLVEAADPIGINVQKARSASISEKTIDFLQETYKDKSKTYFSTPFENLISSKKKNLSNQDAIFFNNVIQHVDFGQTKQQNAKVFGAISDMLDNIKDNGLFCFSCEKHVLNKHPDVSKNYQQVLNMLKQKGFVQIDENLYQKKSMPNFLEAQRAQVLYGIS